MAEAKPVIEYYRCGNTIRLLEDGRLQVLELRSDINRNEVVNELLKESRILPEQVRAYADRLVLDGFFGFKSMNLGVLAYGGSMDRLTLDYNGKKKDVVCQNRKYPSPQFGKVINELEILVERIE